MKIIFVASFLLVLSTVEAQLTPLDILKQSAASMKALNAIQYAFYAEQGGEKINGEVVVNRVKPFEVFGISQVKFTAISSSDEGPSRISFASDGTVFEYVVPASGKTVSIDHPTISNIMQSGLGSYAMLPLPCYLDEEPFQGAITNLQSITFAADTIIYGTNCHKLNVVTSGMDGSTHQVYWFIGKEDGLVRGMQSQYLRQLINIISTKPVLTHDFFRLTAAPASIKKTDGNMPLTSGLLPVGSTAPLWSLPSSKSSTIQLAALKGKVVVLDFWGTWCVPCIRAMPDIQEIHEFFKGKPVEVIGVSVEMKKTADPAGFASSKGYTYTIAFNGHEITKKYQVLTYPTLYIIDKNGRIIHAEHTGGRENFKEDIIAKVNEALSK